MHSRQAPAAWRGYVRLSGTGRGVVTKRSLFRSVTWDRSQAVSVLRTTMVALLCLAGCSEEEVDPCTESGSPQDFRGCSSVSQPETLATRPRGQVSEAYHQLALAQDDSHVYWSTESGDLLRTAKAGGETVELIPAEECTTVGGLAVGSRRVYWTQYCRKDGGATASVQAMDKAGGEPQVLATHSLTSSKIYLDGDHLVWRMRDGERTSHLYVLDLRLTQADPVEVVRVDGPYLPFAVLDGHVYWRESSGVILRQALATAELGAADFVLRPEGRIESLRAENGVLIWVEENEPLVRTAWTLSDTEPPKPRRLVAGRATEFVLSDDGHETWGVGHLDDPGPVNLRVFRWDDDASEPVVWVAPLAHVDAAIMDDAHIYWLDRGHGAEHTVRLARVNRR